MSQPVLICDVLNIFIRAFSAYPQMSPINGHQIGGAVGTLKMIGKVARELKPSRIYMCWEGGGSKKRRALLPEYKLSRMPDKLNRFYGNDIPETEENRRHQLLYLLKLARCLPFCNLYTQDCEGDDLVAYLCRGPLVTQKKVIMSDDKDLYQLFDDDTWSYSPHNKRCITKDDVFERYRITASNIAVAKALCGDKGDNVPGVKGLGFKTCSKRFPMLGFEQPMLLSDVLAFAASHRDEARVYADVCEAEAEVKRNYRLVHLDGGMLPASQRSTIDDKILNYQPKIDRIGLISLLKSEGIGDFDVLSYAQNFDVVMASE